MLTNFVENSDKIWDAVGLICLDIMKRLNGLDV